MDTRRSLKTERCGVYLVVAVSAQHSAFSQGVKTTWLGWGGGADGEGLLGIGSGQKKGESAALMRAVGFLVVSTQLEPEGASS